MLFKKPVLDVFLNSIFEKLKSGEGLIAVLVLEGKFALIDLKESVVLSLSSSVISGGRRRRQ